MKRKLLSTFGAVFALGLLVSAAFVGVTHAADVRAGETSTLTSSETTDSTLYASGNTVSVAGTVKGDVFCAGGNIDITGTVEGDVICAGQAIRITGKVLGDVRVAGQSIEITSEVQGSVSAMGDSIILGPESKIGRDITVGGNRVYLEGQVGRDVLGGAESINVSGTIGRTIEAEVSSLTVDSKARIGGDLRYRSEGPAQIASDAVIAGETRYTERTRDQQENAASVRVWGAFYGFVAMFIIGLAALIIAPRCLDEVATVVRKRPALSFAAGAAVLVAVPIAGIVLLASIFGIPLGVIVFMLWIVGFISSYVFAAYALGWIAVERMNWPKRGRRLTSLLIGLLLVAVIGMIPLVGPVVIFLLMLIGMGALVVSAAARLKGRKAGTKEKA